MTDWKKEFEKYPCCECKWRWPNSSNPDETVGNGCDQTGCTERPDLVYMFEKNVEKNNDCKKCIYDNNCPSQDSNKTKDCLAYYNVSGLHLRRKED